MSSKTPRTIITAATAAVTPRIVQNVLRADLLAFRYRRPVSAPIKPVKKSFMVIRLLLFEEIGFRQDIGSFPRTDLYIFHEIGIGGMSGKKPTDTDGNTTFI